MVTMSAKEKMKRRNSTPAARERKRRWYMKHKLTVPNFIALTHRLNRYGLTERQYQKLLVKQDFKCRVCVQPLISPCVDHNHRTGKVRGILCRKCNSALGMINDSEFNLARLMAYLEWTQTVQSENWTSCRFADFPVSDSRLSTFGRSS